MAQREFEVDYFGISRNDPYLKDKNNPKIVMSITCGYVTDNCGMRQLSGFALLLKYTDGFTRTEGLDPNIGIGKIIADWFASATTQQLIDLISAVPTSGFLERRHGIVMSDVFYRDSIGNSFNIGWLMSLIAKGKHGNYVMSPMFANRNYNYQSHPLRAMFWFPDTDIIDPRVPTSDLHSSWVSQKNRRGATKHSKFINSPKYLETFHGIPAEESSRYSKLTRRKRKSQWPTVPLVQRRKDKREVVVDKPEWSTDTVQVPQS